MLRVAASGSDKKQKADLTRLNQRLSNELRVRDKIKLVY
jgi:hypothetical protein